MSHDHDAFKCAVCQGDGPWGDRAGLVALSIAVGWTFLPGPVICPVCPLCQASGLAKGVFRPRVGSSVRSGRKTSSPHVAA